MPIIMPALRIRRGIKVYEKWFVNYTGMQRAEIFITLTSWNPVHSIQASACTQKQSTNIW